jgi:hypothetical protein
LTKISCITDGSKASTFEHLLIKEMEELPLEAVVLDMEVSPLCANLDGVGIFVVERVDLALLVVFIRDPDPQIGVLLSRELDGVAARFLLVALVGERGLPVPRQAKRLGRIANGEI